jgi:hypothetical protein
VTGHVVHEVVGFFTMVCVQGRIVVIVCIRRNTGCRKEEVVTGAILLDWLTLVTLSF